MGGPSAWYRRLMALAELKGDQTQQAVAETLDVSKASVTNWKNGTRPDLQAVIDAANAYDADLLELIKIAYGDDGEHPTKKRPPQPGRKKNPKLSTEHTHNES